MQVEGDAYKSTQPNRPGPARSRPCQKKRHKMPMLIANWPKRKVEWFDSGELTNLRYLEHALEALVHNT